MFECFQYIVNRYAFLPPLPSRYTESSLENFLWIDNVKVSGEKIPSVYYVCKKPKSTKRLVLFSHGNAEDLFDMQTYLPILSEMIGVDFLSYDYDGYGVFADRLPWESSCFAAIESAYAFAIASYEPSNIYLWGRSLGSGPTTYLASLLSKRAPSDGTEGTLIGGMLLECPLKSAISVVNSSLSDYFFMMDIFNNGSYICDVRRIPTILVHGDQDSVVPVDHSHYLWDHLDESCRIALRIVPHANHNIDLAIETLPLLHRLLSL